MAVKNRRTTVYLDPMLYKALQYKALLNDTSISEMINDMIRAEMAEDAADLAIIEERKNEIPIPFDEFVKKLKEDGLI